MQTESLSKTEHLEGCFPSHLVRDKQQLSLFGPQGLGSGLVAKTNKHRTKSQYQFNLKPYCKPDVFIYRRNLQCGQLGTSSLVSTGDFSIFLLPLRDIVCRKQNFFNGFQGFCLLCFCKLITDFHLL